MSHAAQRGRGTAYVALATASCLWGTGFFFGKIDLEEMSVGHMLVYRFVFACIGLIPVLLRNRQVPRRDDLPLFLIAAALYIPLQFIVEFQGLARTTVSHASLMVGTLPLMLAAGAVVFTHERLDRTGWLALVVSTVGAILIAFQAHSDTGGAGPTLFGDLLVLVALLGGVGWVLITQRVMHKGRGYPSLVMSIYILLFGSAMLVAWVLATEGLPPVHGISTRAWLALAAQGFLATTLTTLLWNWGLQRVSAARAGVFINLEPVIGTVLGVGLLGETLGPGAIAGGLLIVGAAVIFSLHAPDDKDTAAMSL
ncbi:MAG: EamA family transporter [Gemmatimonadaceae bacterium]